MQRGKTQGFELDYAYNASFFSLSGVQEGDFRRKPPSGAKYWAELPDSFEAKSGHVKKTFKLEFLEPPANKAEIVCQMVHIYTVLCAMRIGKM